MIPVLQRLASGDVLLADGAIGTLLVEWVLRPGESPESATRSHPEAVEEIARLYLDAGADILETNTFGASPLKLALARQEAEVVLLNRRAVEIARRVAGERAYVAASVGPSGRLLEPYGDVPTATVYDSFRVQMEHLLMAGPDCVFIETMTDLNEARLAIRAAKEVSPDIPVAAMLTFDRTPRGFYTIMGVSVEAAARGLEEAGADIIGSNCGNGTGDMIEIVRELRRFSELPLIIQPNAGLPCTVEGRAVYLESPSFMAEGTRELLGAGASIVGGCCGTTPEHIRALRAVLATFSD
jgi:5-methyltetrahydrofolate--homocysteine methyltransferase